MLYKKLEDNSWIVAESEINTPSEVINKDKLVDGWEYYESEPAEYIDWLKSLENSESKSLPFENMECGYYKKYYS